MTLDTNTVGQPSLPPSRDGCRLETIGLTKLFGEHVAVNDVALRVESGSIIGLVGPNGAGKTTLLRLLAGLLPPSSGTIRIEDCSLEDPAVNRRRVALVPAEPDLMDNLSPWEILSLAGSIDGVPRDALDRLIWDVLALWNIEHHAHQLTRTLSHGTRQKVSLALALLHRPDVLLLDEPMVGLDIYAAAILEELVRQFARGGRIIVISSHVISLIERTCERVAVLVGGRLVYAGRTAEVGGTIEDVLHKHDPRMRDAIHVATEMLRTLDRAWRSDR